MALQYHVDRYADTNLWAVFDRKGGVQSYVGTEPLQSYEGRGAVSNMAISDEVAAIFQKEKWADAWCKFMNMKDN